MAQSRGPETGRRQVVTSGYVVAADLVAQRLRQRLKEKGQGSYSSRHELWGVIREEYKELERELGLGVLSATEPEGEVARQMHLRRRDRYIREGTTVREELLDLAVACVIGVACIDAGTLEW